MLTSFFNVKNQNQRTRQILRSIVTARALYGRRCGLSGGVRRLSNFDFKESYDHNLKESGKFPISCHVARKIVVVSFVREEDRRGGSGSTRALPYSSETCRRELRDVRRVLASGAGVGEEARVTKAASERKRLTVRLRSPLSLRSDVKSGTICLSRRLGRRQ